MIFYAAIALPTVNYRNAVSTLGKFTKQIAK